MVVGTQLVTPDSVDTEIADPQFHDRKQESVGSSLKQTVIIFDWDDTLMASSWVDRSKLLHIDSFSSLSTTVQQQFAVLEELVGNCLRAAAQLGSVIIITNAESGWVEYSSRRFMPRLVPLLESMRVVSARSTYEQFYPGAPLCWKAAAFAHEANQIFGKEAVIAAQREIVSIGDSNEERTAVKIACEQLGAVSKSLKFVDLPNPDQLCKQVETVTAWLSWVLEHGSDLDLMLKATLSNEVSSTVAVVSQQSGKPWHPSEAPGLIAPVGRA
jgi:hypothetical protein